MWQENAIGSCRPSWISLTGNGQKETSFDPAKNGERGQNQGQRLLQVLLICVTPKAQNPGLHKGKNYLQTTHNQQQKVSALKHEFKYAGKSWVSEVSEFFHFAIKG